MSILYVVTNLFQLVLFTALTGILFALAAISLLMEATIVHFVQPMTTFMLHHSGKLAIFQVVLSDLNTKFPCLQYILRPEYTPYLNTAGTVLLGWLIISWISYLVWVLLAPLTVTVIAIILICPMTAKWCLEQTVPSLEVIFNEFAEKFQTVLSWIRG